MRRESAAVADGGPISAEQLGALLDDGALRVWLAEQRWYASKTRTVSSIELVESVWLSADPGLLLALVQARFATGAHQLYQLPLLVRSGGDGGGALRGNGDRSAPIASSGTLSIHDALGDHDHARVLMERIDADASIDTPQGRFSFHRVNGAGALSGRGSPRAIGVEQSNTSVVFADRLVLKVFRRLEPGINPELEMLRFLTANEFPNIAPLHGWYEYDGPALAATLGVAQEFLPDAVGGWELALEETISDPGVFIERLAGLGRVTAALHCTLATDAGDPAFSPEEPSQESIALLTATIDEDIERIFLRLPDDERFAPIAGRGQDVRERLAARTHFAIGGRVIRTHGDYHLGQTLMAPRGWVVIDFEGEPARPLSDRRRKRSALRDVAGMLRSFAYVTSAVTLLRGDRAPADFEQRARDAFLEAYFDEVDSSLLPPGDAAVSSLLAIFELEKAIYELQYELDNRPEWVSIPVAGIVRLLESS
jgi:maltokinase